MMKSCIFCKIVSGELPSYKVYEDDLFIGILDLYPRSMGHTLIIPKKHYRFVYDVPEFDRYWMAARTVTSAIQTALQPAYISYLTLGLQVPHAHIHVMPRYNDSESMPASYKASEAELQETMTKLKSSL